MGMTRILPAIFLCSFAGLAYQVVLTRVFSISLWYHFSFMIISIAMLGIGASGTVMSMYQGLGGLSRVRIYSLLLGISIPLSYIVSNQIPFDPVELFWSRAEIGYIALYYIILSVPFLLGGLVIASALSSMSRQSGLLYGADLLGAGLGSIGVICLMWFMEPERVVFVLSSIVLLAPLLLGGRVLRTISLTVIIVNLFIYLLQPGFVRLRISQYKGLQVALRYPGAGHLRTYNSPFSRIDTFRSPAVRFAPGLSLRYLDPLPEQVGFSIDGGDIGAITKAGESPTFLRYLPSALPYEIGGKDDVLIIDPKGGLQVLVARSYGARDIYKVESDPLLVRVIREEFGDFSGNIYQDDTWTGLGRSWLRRSGEKFDIIDMSLMGAFPSGSFGISEDYRFTVEAFRQYIGALKPGGILAINLFILPPPRIELRLLSTIVTALEEMGIREVDRYVAAIRSWGSICILVKNTPFTPVEIEGIRRFSKDRRFDLIYYPGIRRDETNRYVRMPADGYLRTFRAILSREGRERFIRDYIFDISPVRDDAPFFHYYLRLSKIREIYRVMGEKWQYFIEEGYILPLILLQVAVLGVLLMILPLFSRRGGPHVGRGFLPYFAFLGLGFMFIEISLIQRAILPLEHPSYAAATVLASVLVGSGLGSLLGHRVSWLRTWYTPIMISAIVAVYGIVMPGLSRAVAPYPLSIKIVSIILFILPLGLLMGVPFPTGLRLLGRVNAPLIPWAWAINGCLSVLAPVLGMMLAMAVGFKGVMWLGSLNYLAAGLMLILSSVPARSSAQTLQDPAA